MTILNLTILKTHKELSLTGKHLFRLVIIVWCLVSCSDVQERVEPDRLLSEDQMVDIYVDMMILDAVKRTNAKIYSAYSLDAKQHIYNKFKVDSTTLKQNIDYYNLEFETNIDIFNRVNTIIVQKKEYFDSINKTRDSLEKVKLDKKRDSIKNSVKSNVKVMSIENN